MRKLLCIVLFIVSFVLFSPLSFSFTPSVNDCEYDGWSIKWSLDNCFTGNKTSVVTTTGNLEVAGGLKEQILRYNRIIAGILWLIAVGSIVYGGLLFVMSGWGDERVTKWKNVIKWAIIGLFLLVAASSIVALVVNIVFGFGV